MRAGKRIKAVVSMIGLDGHSTGAEIVSKMLIDAGMEVVYLGYYNMPETIVQTAVQEDADVIGISSHAANYGQIAELMDLLREKEMGHVLVICGGTIPHRQILKLKEKGVAEVFPPQSTSESIINYIVSNVKTTTDTKQEDTLRAL
jgi:methylmalonyl-CoA mutase, C-terminal domain